MTDLTQARLRPLADTSPSAVVAGFIAMMTGYTSSLVLMFQAGQAAGLSSGQISSWIWALSIGMAICSIGLSLRYRTPITVAWSTPGAALLITSLSGVSYGEAIGAYITCAVLVTICGLTGSFERLVKRLPSSLAAALLAGILFKIGSEIFVAAQHRTGLVLGMFSAGQASVTTLCGAHRTAGRYPAVRVAWPAGLQRLPSGGRDSAVDHAVVLAGGDHQHRHSVVRGGDDLTEYARHRRAAGRRLQRAGLAADQRDRYRLAAAGGIFGATLAALFAALPKELVLSIAALALFGSIINGLSIAMNEPKEREAALITFMVTASGFTLFSVGSAFWGIVAGVLTLLILNWRKA